MPCPRSLVGSSPCTLLAPPPPHVLLPLAPRVALHELRCDLAVHVGVQPAVEFQHIQRHGHELDVYRALRTCPVPDPQSGSRLHAACAAATSRPSSSRSACHPLRILRLSIRQYAVAFNQPLSLDTSKVTSMSTMLLVRSARALPPIPSWVLARTLHAPPPPHRPPSSRPASHPIVCPLFDSAGRIGIQPAAELRHLQSHRHELHVYCALHACPGPRPQLGPRPHVTCATAAPSPSRLPARMPPFRLDRKQGCSTSR